MPDQRALLRGRLASAIDAIADVASGLEPPQVGPAHASPPPPPAPVGRPWSMAAAMEPIGAPPVERFPSPGTPPPPPPPTAPPPPDPPGRHLPTAIIGSSLLALIVAAVVVLRLLPGASPALLPSAPRGPTGHVALTAVRPVAPITSGGGATLPTQVSFPAGTATVDIEVSSGGATVQAPVSVSVSVGQPARTVIDATYLLNPSGETVITLTPAGGAFAPGDYSVAITAGGLRLGATAFDVR